MGSPAFKGRGSGNAIKRASKKLKAAKAETGKAKAAKTTRASKSQRPARPAKASTVKKGKALGLAKTPNKGRARATAMRNR